MTKFLEKLAYLTIKGDDKKGDKFTAKLDDRLLETPSVALENARIVLAEMSTLATGSLKKALGLLDEFDQKIADEIAKEEEKVDIYEDELGSYLVKLSAKPMTEHEGVDVTKYLHMIGDFERISDHAVNIMESVLEMKDKGVVFSDYAKDELGIMCSALREILTITDTSFINSDYKEAAKVEPLEQVVDNLRDQIKYRHTKRLQKNLCSIENGFILSDIITNLERVSDHCSNIAGCLIEMGQNERLDLHSYLNEIKHDDKAFAQMEKAYEEKYALAEKFL
jgi:phosphate:Na+ symporter